MNGDRLIVAGLLVIAVPFAALVLLAIGPIGWLGLGGLLVLVGIAANLRDDDSDGTVAGSGWNCPDCGARNGADAAACHYCGREPDDADGEPADAKGVSGAGANPGA